MRFLHTRNLAQIAGSPELTCCVLAHVARPKRSGIPMMYPFFVGKSERAGQTFVVLGVKIGSTTITFPINELYFTETAQQKLRRHRASVLEWEGEWGTRMGVPEGTDARAGNWQFTRAWLRGMHFGEAAEGWPPEPTVLYVEVGKLRLTIEKKTGDGWATFGPAIDVKRQLRNGNWTWFGRFAKAFSLGEARLLEPLVPDEKIAEWRARLRSIEPVGGSGEFQRVAVQLLFVRVAPESDCARGLLARILEMMEQGAGQAILDVINSGLDILPQSLRQPLYVPARRAHIRQVEEGGADVAKWRRDIAELTAEVQGRFPEEEDAERVIVVGQALITAEYLNLPTGNEALAGQIGRADSSLRGFCPEMVRRLRDGLRGIWP